MGETIGLLGGSFNPIHLGHLAMAEAAEAELRLRCVLIIPAGDPPHKSVELADKLDRLRMAELAAAGRFEVSRIEIDRAGKTYTVDTLETLHAKYPGADIVMIVGADTLPEIQKWHRPERVASLCRFAVFSRDGLPLQVPEGIRAECIRKPVPSISATQIRARVHNGLSLDGYTPRPVADYIGERRLYDPPTRLPRAKAVEALRRMLSEERFLHVLGVEKTIERLAQRWGADPVRAARTGLLHDCAKGMSLTEMRAYVVRVGERVDSLRYMSRELLHAPAGSALAREVFGETAPDILRAIWYHNTGIANASLLDKLLYLADMTEPTRKSKPWREALRSLSLLDLNAAWHMALRVKLDYLCAAGSNAVHPDTVEALRTMETEK